MKNKHSYSLLFLLFILLWFSCASPPDFKKDGGTRITLEMALGDVLIENMNAGDSIAHALVAETYRDLGKDGANTFIELYFEKLEKASPVLLSHHFHEPELKARRSKKEIIDFFMMKVQQATDRSVMVLSERLKEFGAEGARVYATGTNRLILELPGKYEMPRVRKLLQSSANLEFWETWENPELYPKLDRVDTTLARELMQPSDTALQKSMEGTSLDAQLTLKESDDETQHRIAKAMHPLWFLLNPAVINSGRGFQLQEGPVVGRSRMKDTAIVNRHLNSPAARKILGPYVQFVWSLPVKGQGDLCELVALRSSRKGGAVLSGEIVADAHVTTDENVAGPSITMTMVTTAGMDWENITGKNIEKCIAIVVDGVVYSYPRVVSKISGGVSQITGDFTMVEAKDLCNVLKVGKLPVRIRIVEEVAVPPAK